MNREELIAALERVTGPSRVLDLHIEKATRIKGGGIPYYVPAFTASIDAALTLVPERFKDMNLRWRNGYCWEAELCEPSHEVSGLSKTLPIALCIAALKARAP